MNRASFVSLTSLCLVLASISSVFAQSDHGQPGTSKSVTFRVGITPYHSSFSKNEHDGYIALFNEWKRLAKELDPTVDLRFEIDYGLNAEINSWATTAADPVKGEEPRPQIDVAVASAKVAANLILKAEKWRYVTTRLNARKKDKYTVSCITHMNTDESTIESFKVAIKRAKENSGKFNANNQSDEEEQPDRFKVILTDPFSTSGYAVPKAFLDERQVPIKIEESGSHEASIRKIINDGKKNKESMNEADSPIGKFAFVASGEIVRDENGDQQTIEKLDGKKLRVVEITGLTTVGIPELAWIARNDFKEGTTEYRLIELLKKIDGLKSAPDGRKIYADISLKTDRSRALSWKQLALQLRQIGSYSKLKGAETPRIALVLAGGGAKCAAQIGIIKQIVQQLHAANEHLGLTDSEKKFDISLVVGTSGGAFNALPVALDVYPGQGDNKINAPDESYEKLESAWKALDARDIIVPRWPLRILIGIWSAFLWSVLLLLCNRLFVKDENKAQLFARLCLVIASIQVITILLPLPWDLVLNSPSQYVLWTLMGSGNEVSALAMLLLYLVIHIINRRRQAQPSAKPLVLPAQAVANIACFGLVTMLVGPLIFFGTSSTICVDSGLVNTVSKTIESVVLAKANDQKIAVEKDRLTELSKIVFENKLLKCDMIVTATEAIRRHGEWIQPREKYFIAMTDENRAALLSDEVDPIDQQLRPEAYDRFTFLLNPDEQPSQRMTNTLSSDRLMDVVIGSGSVYPFFPPRKMGLSYLIDGSYSHHRPIEAAWLRGATHVFLIDPNPASERKPRILSFYSGLGLAVEQLFNQAQSTDRAVLGKLKVIQFQPKAHENETGISLLSFARKPIEEAIDRGLDPQSVELQLLNTGPPQGRTLEQFEKLRVEEMEVKPVVQTPDVKQQANVDGESTDQSREPIVRGQSE